MCTYIHLYIYIYIYTYNVLELSRIFGVGATGCLLRGNHEKKKSAKKIYVNTYIYINTMYLMLPTSVVSGPGTAF